MDEKGENMQVTIEDVKRLESKLEDDILDLVVKFEKATGMNVENIHFETRTHPALSNPVKVRAIITSTLG